MTEYINKEFYKEIPPQERHYINLNSNSINVVMDKLNAEGVLFSATLSNYKNVITVHKADSERTNAIVSEAVPGRNSDTRIIGNTDYRSISDKRYINMDADTAMKVAAVLSGDNSSRFSGRIIGDRATITVSGDKNAVNVRRMADNIKNSDLLSLLDERGFERVNLNNGFVNLRNHNTGVVEGFENLDAVCEMFRDEDNEFFHPAAYRLELTSDAYEDVYYISHYDIYSGVEKTPYYDNYGMPTFVTVDDAIRYAEKNNIAITNPDDELQGWIQAEVFSETEKVSEENRSHIADFPMQNGLYPDHFRYDETDNSFIWTYFNPDGDSGKGEFVEKYISEQDIYAAYMAGANAENETDGRNAFINYIFENCREAVIDTYSGYFQGYADDYINKPDAVAEFYGIGENSTYTEDMTALVTLLEESCPAVAEERNKQAESENRSIDLHSEGIEIEGYSGTWYVIDVQRIQDRDLFLLESEIYGDEAACLIVDENRNVVMDNVHNGFDDYIEAVSVDGNQMTVRDEAASEKSYAEQLYERVNDEYSFYIGQMKKESPEVLIESAAEIVDKDRIRLFLEENEPALSDEQFEALLSRNAPLDEIYEQWVENGELNSIEDVGIVLEEAADRILVSIERENFALFRKENLACSHDVDAYLSKHYNDNRLDSNGALSELLERYTLEKIQIIVAANLYKKDYDARISKENYSWANDVVGKLSDNMRAGIDSNHLTAHPGLLNLFADTVRKHIEKSIEKEKSSDRADVTDLDTAKKYIEDFHRKEYGENKAADFSDLHNIGLVYTTLGDEGEYEFQVTADLAEPSISYSINGEIVRTDIYDDLADMIEKDLSFLDFDYFQTEGYKELEKKYPEKEQVNVVLAVSQYDTNRYYIANDITVDAVRNAITNSDRLFMELCALGGEQINEAEFAEYSQRDDVSAIDVNIDEQTMHVYGAEKPIVSFEEIKGTDEIAAALDLANNTISFSVVTIEGEKPFVTGGYIDKYDITDLEEYQDYIYDTGRRFSDVTVEYYQIGGGDNESINADSDELSYISEHLDEVLAHRFTDCLESETYSVAAPAELLEEISGEKEIDRADENVRENLFDTLDYDVNKAVIDEKIQSMPLENAAAENLVWKEVFESIDEETGEPSIWSAEVNSERYGRYLWITMNEDNKYDVEYDTGGRIIPVSSESVGFRSLAAAKEWVEEDLLDMSENKFYSDDRPVRREFYSNISPTVGMADHILRCGSIEPNSLERIVRQFQKQRTTAENAEFLKNEFGEDGRGYFINDYSEFKVSAWFDKSGIYTAVSDTAFPTGRRSHIGWEEAAERIGTMLENGNYCSQEIIDRARDHDIKDIANDLWYLHQDSNIPFFIPEYFFKGGFDESTEKIAEALHGITSVNEFADGLNRFIEMYKENPDVMRFHFHKPSEILDRIKALQSEYDPERERFEYPEFETNSNFRSEQRFFITEDEKDNLLLNGSGVSGGKFRIEEYFKQKHNAKEKADFLKNEYGTGGSGRTGYNTSHDSNGIVLQKGIGENSCEAVMNWSEVVKRIDRLVSAGKYISDKDIEQRIRSAKYDIEHYDINNKYERPVIERAMAVLDKYGVSYDKPQRDPVDILLERFTEPHKGKLEVEKYYENYRPTIKDLAFFMQELAGNRQGFGIKDYALTPTGIIFADLSEYSWEQIAQAAAKAMDSGRYISAEERTENDHTPKYTIYQIPAGEEHRDVRFMRYEQLELMGKLPDRANYEKVYSGRLDDIEYNDKLEGIFVKFNMNRPDDFDGHSLSVSDVVVIEDENGKKAHYVDDIGFKDITDIFLERAQDTQQKEVPLTVGVIEKYGLEIDFKEIDRIILRTENEQYEGGYDSEGHERKDNFSHSTTDVSIHYSENDYSLVREDDNKDAILIGRDHTAITIDAALTEIQDFLDESFDDRDKSVYIKYDDGRTQYINAEKLLEAARAERTAEPIRMKPGSEIEVGDRFLYNDREYTVTSEKGIYPYEVGVSYEEKTGDISYEVTSNINRYKLAENGIFLGNSDKEKQENIQSPVGTENKADIYEPKIGDLIEYQDALFKIADVNESSITLQTADTLIPDTIVVSVTDLIASDSFSVIEENGEPVPEKKAFSINENAEEQLTENQPKAQNFVITDENFGVPGGAKARYADNALVIKTLKAIEAENRTATPEEQLILSKYTGWGAIPQAFDIGNDKWRTEYAELRTLLTPEEYAAARKSVMNAHYTSPTVISAIYDGLEKIGFENGRILEPAVGIGNFFGVMPEAMRNSKLSGVELDSLTGRIAQQLYPNADIQIKGFEETTFADNSFDVAIGNVPFGDYKLNDRRYNDNNFLIHDYFFAKALDKVHPGGIVAFVTSKGTLDKENPAVRKYLAQRAELLGAIRLPNNAFKANAGTEVTSDIIFLQKRERPIEIYPDEVEWLNKAVTSDGFSVNNYFVKHPEMVLGTITEAKQIYGPTENTQVIPTPGADLKQQLAEAIKNIQGQYRAAEKETVLQNIDGIPAPANSRKYSFYAVDGSLYYREAEDTMKKVNVSKDTLNRAVGLIELRDNIRELLDMQLNNSDGTLDGDITESREKLNKSYDSFVARYGNVSDRKNAKAMQGDDGYNIVSALEVKDEKGKVTGKADIFTHNTVKPKTVATHVDTAEEALILSVAEKAKMDFEYMTSLCGIEKDKLISELSGQIFRLPQEEEKYVTADEYLTGNIRKKISELENAPEDMDISENRAALEAAMPPRVEAKDISVKLGAHWVDPKYIGEFINEKFNPDYDTRRQMSVQYSAVAGTWKIENVKANSKRNYYSTNTYGTHRKNAYEIIEAILNNGDIQVKDRVKDEYGNDMRDRNGKYILVINDEETKAARRCANIIKSEFRDWIFKDPERREALVQKYNEVYNSIRHREYDGSHLNFSGMNTDITLKEHQKNAIARGLYGGNSLLAHAVGAGKSVTRS